METLAMLSKIKGQFFEKINKIYKPLVILIKKKREKTQIIQTQISGTTDWFQIGKGVREGYILSWCLFNFYAEYIMRNGGLEEAQAGIKIAWKNNNLRQQMTPPLRQKEKKD